MGTFCWTTPRNEGVQHSKGSIVNGLYVTVVRRLLVQICFPVLPLWIINFAVSILSLVKGFDRRNPSGVSTLISRGRTSGTCDNIEKHYHNANEAITVQ